MEVFRESENLPSGLRGAVVTIGNFDGVHLGHQQLFRRLVAEAGKVQRPAVVISFDPHPKRVLHPERRPFYLITSLEEKIRHIAALGIDALILIPFSPAYAKTTAAEFINQFLWKRLAIWKIIIGHDYTFGRGKEGSAAFLTDAGRRLGFAVEMLGAVQLGVTTVSSTRIREAILGGDVRSAASFLGRPYNLSGEVVSGHRRGISLGYPTANLRPNKELLPLSGVYAVWVLLGDKRYPGVLSIGYNPTFDDRELSIEVHLIDFRQDIYGKTLEILFIERLRSEVRFAGRKALIAQIDLDVARAREVLRQEDPLIPPS